MSILADGAVEPPQAVKDGKITLTYPAKVVHVGLPFMADMKTLPAARERQKFCVHGIIGARQTGASNEHEHQTQFS